MKGIAERRSATLARKALLARKTRIAGLAAGLRAAGPEGQEVIESLQAAEGRELAEIDAALERLYNTPEKFGICEDTGEDIPYERLDIIPWARTCGGTGRRSGGAVPDDRLEAH